MYDLCDAAVILPGGNGTLDEMFEMLTWNTLKIHDKKIILLNSAGFYDHLINHINHMQQCKFLYEDWTKRIFVAPTAHDAISFLAEGKN
ncbi:MAG: LOG family protein, partial [Segetibacter sp.]